MDVAVAVATAVAVGAGVAVGTALAVGLGCVVAVGGVVGATLAGVNPESCAGALSAPIQAALTNSADRRVSEISSARLLITNRCAP